MGPAERRQGILDVLCFRRYDTCANLASEFNVSERTIRRDISVLTCSYPIETVRGGHHGGVRISDDYISHQRHQRFTPKQADLLRKLSVHLSEDDLEAFNGILLQFAP